MFTTIYIYVSSYHQYINQDSRATNSYNRENFKQYLTAAEGKTKEVANRIATDVYKFFDQIPHTSHAIHRYYF